MHKTIFVPVVLLKTKMGYNAFSPVVEGCFATDRTMDKTLKRMKEALEFHLEGEHLVKQFREPKAVGALRKSFDNYGTEAVYASLQVAA